MSLHQHYDIVFLGGRIAGGMGARFLKLNFKDKKILILEKNEKLNWSPGESSVGVTGLFLIRDLGLSTYFYLNHLPKNGLRFIFDDGTKPFRVEDCSEIGSTMFPVFPTFQIDRARFDSDLWQLNRDIGIDVLTGVDVNNIVIGKNENHTIDFTKDGKTHHISCEWIVNSTGRYSKVNEFFDKLNPVASEGYLNTAAAWGRFENVTDIDLLGDEEWRKKAGFSSRYLSTTHFMKEGSWTWQIPIDRNIVSFGIVYDKSVVKDKTDTPEDFVATIKKNRFIAKLLENAKLLDFQNHHANDFKKSYFALPEKVMFIGEAFGFIDPLYSQGSDIISRECYMMKHLIEAKDKYEERRLLINQIMINEFEYINLLYKNQYAGFGSFDIYNIKSKWDFYCYTNRLVWLFYSKKYANFDWLENEVHNHALTIKITRAVQNGFVELNHYLRSINQFERNNNGHYSAKQNRFVIEEMMLAGLYNDSFSRTNNFAVTMLSICEMLEMRFDLKNLVNNKLFQDHLNLSAICEFELKPEWFNNFLTSISNTINRQLSASGELKDNQFFNLTIEDLRAQKISRAEFSTELNQRLTQLVFLEKPNRVQFQLDHLHQAVSDNQQV